MKSFEAFWEAERVVTVQMTNSLRCDKVTEILWMNMRRTYPLFARVIQKSNENTMKTNASWSIAAVSQESLRLEAIKMVLEGKRQVEVAKKFAVTRQAVSKWLKAYRKEGEKALRAKRTGRPKGRSLLARQGAQITNTIMGYYPEQLKLPFSLWRREAVAQLVEQRFGVRFSIQTIGRYLGDWGFIPQTPLRRALEKKPEEVCRWLEKEYRKIQKQAKREKALIYWGDVTSLQSYHVRGCSYGNSGQIPVIAKTPESFNCNMILATTNRGQFNFMVFKKHFSAEVFEDFIRRLVRQGKRKVFLIFDDSPLYRASKIKIWAKSNLDQTRLFSLPGHSPRLNPEESLNRDFEGIDVERPLFMDKLGLIANLPDIY